ncbi:MAG: acetyl-CoA C-acyltransferase, partial [Candidatus Eremiobacterota bacterium]
GILAGEYECVVVGGVESMSNVPVPYSKGAIDSLMAFSKARSVGSRMKALAGLNMKDLIPSAPSIAEAATGKSMGQHAEMMARKNGISREEQDLFALASQQHASEAWESGKYAEEVCTVWPKPRFHPVQRDNFVRQDTSLEALARLAPAFDRKYGTLTAGNSSGLTDGAAALLVMSEQKAQELGYEPLAYLKSWATASLDPDDQLLMGPALAIPQALDKAGLKLAEIDLMEMHEAFAAQVLSVLKALECPVFAKERLGRDEPVGSVDPSRLNVNGGSIALGHPFGATGARMLITAAHELQRRNLKTACLSLCAAGGLGTAVILER